MTVPGVVVAWLKLLYSFICVVVAVVVVIADVWLYSMEKSTATAVVAVWLQLLR